MNLTAPTPENAPVRGILVFAVLLLPTTLPAQNSGVDWTRFVGGQAAEDCGQRNALWITSAGDSFVAGSTSSTNFPTTVASTPGGGADVCVARIAPDGSQILFGMTFGGSDPERANAIAFDETTGRLYLAGWTRSADFPITPNARKMVLDGAQDGFLTIVDTGSGALVYSTYLGGGGSENIFDLHVDARGIVTLVGNTNSVGIATANAYDPIHNGVFDGMIAQLDPAVAGPTGLQYLTYVGGTDQDFLLGARLHVDARGVLTVCSASASPDFPVTSGAWSTSNQGGPAATPWDAVVFRFDPSLPGAGPLVWSTYFGGAGYENAQAVSVDPVSGLVTVGGTTASAIRFPGNPVQPALAGGADAFVARFDPSQNGAAQLVWGT